MEEKNVHKDHRQRLRKNMLTNGADTFPAHNILELLLFFTIPRIDVNPLAHALLNHFGSFSGVLDASYDELRTVPGIGDSSASLLCVLPSIFRVYQGEKNQADRIFQNRRALGDFLQPMFIGRTHETVIVLFLDLKNRLIDTRIVAEGTIDTVHIPIRNIVSLALTLNAVGIALAHNHPNGIAIPSTHDVDATKKLLQTLNQLGIVLEDHFVVGEDDYVSMRDSAYLSWM